MTGDERYRLLRALAETILPTDDGPGAAEVNAADYVQHALDRRSAQDHAKIEAGLDLVDSMARQRHGKPFEDCAGEERSEILQQLQRVPHKIVRGFLLTVIGLVIEGFLCDPSHGGNCGSAGWRAIGYFPGARR